MAEEENEPVEPIETEPAWGTDLSDDTLLGIDTEPDWRTADPPPGRNER